MRAAIPVREAPDLRPEMVVLPAGSFTMGSPEKEADRDEDEKQRRVVFTRPFLISRTEITQAQYQAVMGVEPVGDCYVALVVDLEASYPVVCVSWFDAVRYANRLSELEGLDAAYQINGSEVSWDPDNHKVGYRLPTEAEWEYAARAGSGLRYVGTADESDVCTFANVRDKAYVERTKDDTLSSFNCNDQHGLLAPVENRAFNQWQLYGFGGNASEWVWDWYDAAYTGETDPAGPESGEYRVIRGGSFRDFPRLARVAYRSGDGPGGRLTHVGFRLSRSCPSSLLPSGTLPVQNCLGTDGSGNQVPGGD